MRGADQPDPSGARAAARSSWLAGEPGLPEATEDWSSTVGPRHAELPERAVRLARGGLVDPVRLARHAVAAGMSRALRVTTSLPAAVTSGRPFTDPQGWFREAAVEAFVDQLALAGPASAELARLIEEAGALFPQALRDELGRRHIEPVPVEPGAAQAILDRAMRSSGSGRRVRLRDRRPFTATPVSQVHRADLDGGRPVAARIRRPRIARDLGADARLAAGVASALARLAPDAGGMGIGPAGFVQLVLRQILESTDLRFDAFDLVELGLLVEQLGADRLVVARPLPGLVAERALVTEDLGGTPLVAMAEPVPDPAGALAALASITLESALVHGTFWADPAPEHLVLLDDGRLGIVGAGTVGRLSPQLRLAGVRVLRALFTGEHEALVEGMRIAGALGADVDVDALVEDLRRSERLQPTTIFFGGEAALLGGLQETIALLLAHRLQPPVEVVLLLRTVFAVGYLARRLDPSGQTGLPAALVPLVPRLPEILAAAEEAVLAGGAPSDATS